MKDILKQIKLIVIDIDGTLVDRDGKVGERSKQLSIELKNHGVLCTLSSARSFHYSVQIANELQIDIPFITLDGALIKSRKNQALHKGVISKKLIDKAVELATNNYGKVALCNEEHVYYTSTNSVVREYSKLNAPIKEIDSYDNVNNILELMIYCEDKSSLKIIKENLRFPHSIGVVFSVTKSLNHEYYLLTIKKKGSDKLQSVKRLVKHLGLKRKNIAVIGDWHNDMPLFDYGAYNIAVQNAIPELKKKAHYVTKATNNEDAVGEILEMIYKYKVNKDI
jgi:Cof subfamily protein (haloacid dehalogenase superfamily)